MSKMEMAINDGLWVWQSLEPPLSRSQVRRNGVRRNVVRNLMNCLAFKYYPILQPASPSIRSKFAEAGCNFAIFTSIN